MGFYNPPLVIVCRDKRIELEALNQRGEVLLGFITPLLAHQDDIQCLVQTTTQCILQLNPQSVIFSEEERSQQVSVFTLLRTLLAFFKSDEDPYLGLYGAFGFDLIYQFEQLPQYKARDQSQRDMVLYLPDEIFIVNHRKEIAFVRRYDFQFQNKSTEGLAREGKTLSHSPTQKPKQSCDHKAGEYAKLVQKAKAYFARGDLFEVVPSQTFYQHYEHSPSVLFNQMRQVNPSPYGFFINLGDEEYLVGASPEMYVRVQGTRVESCPISGTIKRGEDAIEDAQNIQLLLDSEKEKSELTMCTDVDRNDKSRICEAGSVRVIGRRQIEMYSRLIHTVDHVEGTLRAGFDALDAFLTHMWVVTVTGAPKLWAMNFIEENEKSPRRWYAGAVGWLGFDGNLNTGLVLRTVRLQQGIAELRVGATLLYDSIPEDEEQETQLKASAFLDMMKNHQQKPKLQSSTLPLNGQGKTVLLVDHQDSFVHTLANYLRQTGATVTTVRYDNARAYLQRKRYDLVVLSPGPGRPHDFNLSVTIEAVLEQNIPLFGVCLGLQGLVEYFGGDLDVLEYPMHGKASKIDIIQNKGLFVGLNNPFTAARYHSLHARRQTLPKDLIVTALSDDGIVMAISHHHLPVYAVQFHPEALLTLPNQSGLKIINNLMGMLPG